MSHWLLSKRLSFILPIGLDKTHSEEALSAVLPVMVLFTSTTGELITYTAPPHLSALLSVNIVFLIVKSLEPACVIAPPTNALLLLNCELYIKSVLSSEYTAPPTPVFALLSSNTVLLISINESLE